MPDEITSASSTEEAASSPVSTPAFAPFKFGVPAGLTNMLDAKFPMDIDIHPGDALHDVDSIRFSSDDDGSNDIDPSEYCDVLPQALPGDVIHDFSKIDLRQFPFLFQKCQARHVLQEKLLEDFAAEQWEDKVTGRSLDQTQEQHATQLARVAACQMVAHYKNEKHLDRQKLIRSRIATKRARAGMEHWRKRATALQHLSVEREYHDEAVWSSGRRIIKKRAKIP